VVADEPRAVRTIFSGTVLTLELEDWGVTYQHEVVRHPGAAGVLPITPDGDVLLVRQFRPAVRSMLTEIPAGLLDVDGEDALTCAARELFEETGYRHASIEFLGGYYSTAGFSDEYVHLFVARTTPEPEAQPEEGITLIQEPREAMVAAARAGRVRDVKTALALLMADGRA
jgi:ADP-ribose pyrophosphatase